MKRKAKLMILLLGAVLILTGCSMRTVEDMYQLPKRSDDFNHLQAAMDSAMSGLEYCAPLTGENRQTVQMADLDGDGMAEYLLFAKGTQEMPLRILVFRDVDGTYVNTATVSCNGTAFDQVEYVNMDSRGGVEIVVGRQISDQVIRSASVYTLLDDELVQLVSVNYSKLLTTDLDGDSLSELFLLRPGETDTDSGVAELYGIKNGSMERYNEVPMSQPADKLKRIIVGKLDGGKTAVFTASAAGDTALVTDVFTILDGKMVNVAFSNESGTGVKTLRNYYIYADDIDNDGLVELPNLITMKPLPGMLRADEHHLIRWYSMTTDGVEVDKMYTYHNFIGGWYMQLDAQWAQRITVTNSGNVYEFSVWDPEYKTNSKLLSLYIFSGQNREEQSVAEGRFVLYRTESVIYSAYLEDYAQDYQLTQENVVYSFRMIQQDWKTGET